MISYPVEAHTHTCTHVQYLLVCLLSRLEEKAAAKRKENMKARVDRPHGF